MMFFCVSDIILIENNLQRYKNHRLNKITTKRMEEPSTEKKNKVLAHFTITRSPSSWQIELSEYCNWQSFS